MPDLILFNANVISLDPGIKNARMVAVRDGTIIAVTAGTTLARLRRPHTRLIDCNANTLLPGFIDAHCHLWATAARWSSVDLSPRADIQSIADIQSKIKKISKPLKPGTWIRATGYNEFYLKEKRHPTRWDLDEATVIHPVKLTHRSGHAHVLNSLALKLAGITKTTPEPPGGLMDRSVETGEPTGILFEMNAVLSERIPPMSESDLNRGLKLLNRFWLSQGITSFQEASAENDIERWSALCSLKKSAVIGPRITMMTGSNGLADVEKNDFSCAVPPDQLRLGAVKIIVDETTGRLHPSREDLNARVLDIHRNGRQVAIHAIEENAVEAACDAIGYALERLPRSDHRHRIEHCSVCPPSLSKRIASLGIMVVTQPAFIFHHGDRYMKTVPQRQLKHIYPIGSLIRNRVVVAGSSDSPVVPARPLEGIYAAVTRLSEKGDRILPKEGISPLTALRLYTEYAARVCFENESKGTISPGKLADLVLLSGDPTRLPPEKIKDLEVEMTMIGGKVHWSRSG